MRVRTTFLAILVAALGLAPAAAAHSTFTPPFKLSDPPTGGEPSIAASPQGVVMVDGPQGIPSGVNGTPGTGLWISKNDGSTFAKGKFIGSFLGGGDDDVIYDKGTWYEADLEAAATEVCQSTNNGKTWTGVGPVPDPSNCTTVNGGQAGPSDDRPWLTADPTDKKRIYLTYHEFVSAQPISFSTTNGGGDDFANPCGPLVTNPTIEANVPTDITGGTLVARPVVDKHGTLYVLFATTTQQENAQAISQGQPSGTFSQLYLAVSKDHCQHFTDHTVFDGQSKYGMNDVQFGDVFNNLVVDGAGNLYAIGVGFIGKKPFAPVTHVYVLHSTDQGKKWSKPFQLHTPKAADMLPAAIGGPKGGELAIGYFRTTNGITNPNSLKGQWTYSTAESHDATAASPKFGYADVRPGFIYHHGQICNAGILCGVTAQPGDRSLLDFSSATLDRQNCPLFTFAGNPTGTPTTNGPSNTHNFVTRQRSGCFNKSGSTSAAHRHHKRHHAAKHRHHQATRPPRRHRHRRGFTG